MRSIWRLAYCTGRSDPSSVSRNGPRDGCLSLRFVSEDNPSEADIVVLTLAPGELPNSRAALRVRHIGTMRFMPFAAKAYLANASMPKDFDAVRDMALLNHDRYRKDRGLEPWNAIVSSATRGPALSVDTTSGLFRPLVSGCGVALLPRYAHLYEGALTALDIPIPDMRIELWLAAHEDFAAGAGGSGRLRTRWRTCSCARPGSGEARRGRPRRAGRARRAVGDFGEYGCRVGVARVRR